MSAEMTPDEKAEMGRAVAEALRAIGDFKERTTGVRPSREELLGMTWAEIDAVNAEMQADLAAQEAWADLMTQSLDDLTATGIRQGETFGEFTARGGELPESVRLVLRGIAATDPD